MPRALESVGSRTPVTALRLDRERQPDLAAPVEEQGLWVAVLTLVDQAAYESADGGKTLLAKAGALASDRIGAPAVDRAFANDPPFRTAPREMGIVRLLIGRMEEAGALHLALAGVNALFALGGLSTVDEWRLNAIRARVTWRMGDLDGATDVYTEMERVGIRTREPELVVRAWIGYSALAQLRGNYPRVRECATRVLEMARQHGYRRLEAYGHEGLMIVAGNEQDFDSAIVHAWNRYLASPEDPVAERTMLTNLGHLLTEAKQFQAAEQAYARVLSLKLPQRVLLTAAGGAAITSAMLGQVATVRRLTRQVRRHGLRSPFSYEAALALFECATALHLVQDLSTAKVLNEEALRLAETCGYHELVIRSEAMKERMVRTRDEASGPLSKSARAVVDHLSEMSAAVIPSQLVLATGRV